MHVGQQLVKIALIIDQLRLVPTLPKGTHVSMSPVESLNKSNLQRRHRPPKWHVDGSQQQVIVIRHEDPRVQNESVPRFDITQELHEHVRLSRIREDRLTSSDPAVNVINATFHEHSGIPENRSTSAQSHSTMRLLSSSRTWHLSDPSPLLYSLSQ